MGQILDEYAINITEKAVQDLEEIASYISCILKNPQVADAILGDMDSAIKGLAVFPQKHPVVSYSCLQEMGIRFVSVRKYIVFYRIIENKMSVEILRILYGRRSMFKVLLGE